MDWYRCEEPRNGSTQTVVRQMTPEEAEELGAALVPTVFLDTRVPELIGELFIGIVARAARESRLEPEGELEQDYDLTAEIPRRRG